MRKAYALILGFGSAALPWIVRSFGGDMPGGFALPGILIAWLIEGDVTWLVVLISAINTVSWAAIWYGMLSLTAWGTQSTQLRWWQFMILAPGSQMTV